MFLVVLARRRAFVVSAVLVLGAIDATGQDHSPVLFNGREVHPTRILAKVAPKGEVTAHASAFSNTGMQAVKAFDLVPGLVLLEPVPGSAAGAQMQSGDPLERAAALMERIETLRKTGLYEYVEPDYLVFADRAPNDSSFSDGTLWGLRNTGQDGGVSNVDIDADLAWDITTGSTSVVVAVIDTGVRYTHQDLVSQMWHNPGEIAGNGRDDDRNGYVDDVFGINTINGSGNPMDDDGHGTHVAGTIGAAANDGFPMVGVAWNVRIMALKFLDSAGTGETSDALECIQYAVANGAKIINASWGGRTFSKALRDAIAKAGNNGVLVVAAAGNESTNTDFNPHYPSSYDLPNIISVAAIDRRGTLAGFSNLGATSVDLVAPGMAIWSTFADSDASYYTLSGTSMAAPHVTGVAALVRAQTPAIPIGVLRDRIFGTVIAKPSLAGKTATGGIVNANRALTMVPDGKLELGFEPGPGGTLFGGRPNTLVVRVTDLTGVTGATVTGSMGGGGSLTFLDNGIAPDAVAGDANYTAFLNVPLAAPTISVSVSATAVGKTAISKTVDYAVVLPPPNDNFANATLLTLSNFSLSASNIGASSEAGEPSHAGGPGGASVWWSWTSPSNAQVTINTYGSQIGTLLAVYTGDSVGTLSEVTSYGESARWGGGSEVMFSAIAGTRYSIAIDGWDGETGPIALNFVAEVPPDNDNFADSSSIGGTSVRVRGSVRNSTLEPGEPDHGNTTGNGGSVWWTWTPAFSGTAHLEVISADYGSLFFAAYTGNSLATLARLPVLTSDSGQGYRPRMTISVVSGTAYHIAVASSDTNGPEITFSLSHVAGPANDRFSDRLPIVGTSAVVTGNNNNATTELNEPLHGTDSKGASVWWTWTAPITGTAILRASAITSEAVFSVYTGSSLAELDRVAANSSAGFQTTVDTLGFRAVSGQSYQIAVDSRGYYDTGPVSLSLAIVPTPANDQFADRAVLSGAAISITTTNQGATHEIGEPVQGFLGRGSSRWWTWTAPSSGTVVVQVEGAESILNVYKGVSLQSLVSVSNSAPSDLRRHQTVLFAQAGETFQIAVNGRFDAPDTYTLVLNLREPPHNDMFANRAVLSGSSTTFSGDNQYATIEQEEPIHDDYFSGNSLWWTWTAPSSGTAIIELQSAEFFPSMRVYTGSTLQSLVAIEDRGSAAFYLSRIVFSAVAGTSYQIVLESRYTGAGQFEGTLDLVAPPVNDHFSGAVTLSGVHATVSASNLGATTEAGEPWEWQFSPVASVWWRWTAPQSGTLLLTLEGEATAPTMGVFVGNSLSTLSEVPLATTGEPGYLYCKVPVIGGTTYHLVAGAYGGEMSPLQLTLSLVGPPPNDRFVNCTNISGTNTTVNGNNFGATHEPGESAHYGYGSFQTSIWWRWVAPADGGLILSTEGSAIGAAIAVYEPNGSNVPFSMLARDDDPWKRDGLVQLNVKAGAEYLIAVEGKRDEMGDIVLYLSFVDPPANDKFANRGLMSGVATVASGTTLGATADPLEPAHGHYSGAAYSSIWWSWTAPSSGTVELKLLEDHDRNILRIYRGGSLATLEIVGAGIGTNYDRMFGARFGVEKGVTYHFAAEPAYGAGGDCELGLLFVPAPTNDNFAKRTPIVGTQASWSATLSGATGESGEPYFYGVAIFRSLWWTWTPSRSGTVLIEANSGSDEVNISVFEGSELNTLQNVGTSVSTAGRSQLIFEAVAGTAYQISIVSYAPTTALIHLDLGFIGPPVNDRFSDRIRVSGSDVRVTGSNRGARGEVGEPITSYGQVPRSVWWTWTAPVDGRVSISVEESEYPATVRSYTGNSVGALTPTRESEGGATTRTDFYAVAGSTYHFAVDGQNGLMGNIVFTLELRTPPSNDKISDRISLEGINVTTVATTSGAGYEDGEPNWGPDAGPSSVWWQWVAPASGRVVVSARGEESAPYLGIFQGPTNGYYEWIAVSHFIDHQNAERFLAFDAEAGETYLIDAVGFKGWTGEFILSIAMVDPPPNDDFENAIELSGKTGVGQGSTLGASADPQGPWIAVDLDWTASVWWKWTAPESGVFAVSTDGSNFDTAVGVFSGPALYGINLVSFNDDFGGELQSRAPFSAIAGETYHIYVTGKYSAMGDVRVSIGPASPPANNLFENASRISGWPVHESGSNVDATHEPYSGLVGGTYVSGSLWWQWTADSTGFVSVSTHFSEFLSRVVVFSGPDPLSFSWVADSGNYLGEKPLPAIFKAYAGSVYNILVMGNEENSGEFILDIREASPSAPTISGTAQSVAGSAIMLSSGTSNNGSYAYQWFRNGVEIEGANNSSFLINNAQVFHGGTYTVQISSFFGTNTSAPISVAVSIPDTSAGRMTSLSTRAVNLTGDNVLIPGFVIQGAGTKRVLIRAVGPTLAEARFGVANALSDPQMVVKKFINGAYVDVAQNDDWGTNANVDDLIDVSDELYAFELSPGSADAALLLDLDAGQYTVVSSGVDDATGVAIVELYDADGPTSTTKLTSISNRGFVGTGTSVMIPGIVVPQDGPKTLLIRVVGPTLAEDPYNVTGVLEDPVLTVFRGNEAILTNDDWGSDPVMADQTRSVAESLFAFPLAEGSEDAAFVVTLNPGIYTVVASGANGGTGVALVEVYEVP